MNTNSWFSFQKPCRNYSGNEQLFLGVQSLEQAAIVCLQTKALPMIQRIVRDYNFGHVEAEDILNRSTVIFLRKIADGSYQFQGHAPATYLIEIAKKLALMETRAKKRETAQIDGFHHLEDETWSEEIKHREAAELTKTLLNQLGDPCRQVIQLHHIDGYSDEEVVQQKMTRYSTTDSLKMKRSDCMKKLIHLAKEWKTSINI